VIRFRLRPGAKKMSSKLDFEYNVADFERWKAWRAARMLREDIVSITLTCEHGVASSRPCDECVYTWLRKLRPTP